jgi:hypothetical protein
MGRLGARRRGRGHERPGDDPPHQETAERIPDEGREKNGSFAHSVDVPSDASELDRFLARLGRRVS